MAIAASTVDGGFAVPPDDCPCVMRNFWFVVRPGGRAQVCAQGTSPKKTRSGEAARRTTGSRCC
jgi:hypothetical protein